MKNLAHIAMLIGLGARAHKLTPAEQEALRARCCKAEPLELGQLLFEARTDDEARIITDEITRRGL